MQIATFMSEVWEDLLVFSSPEAAQLLGKHLMAELNDQESE